MIQKTHVQTGHIENFFFSPLFSKFMEKEEMKCNIYVKLGHFG